MEIIDRPLKLFMILLGSKAAARNVEQHDYFFGIGRRLKDLIPQIKIFWPEAGKTIHIDGWREVNYVEGYKVEVVDRPVEEVGSPYKLFFINLGGYLAGRLEEQHYTVLTVREDRVEAIRESKRTTFFKHNSMKGANSHIDEKYGIDVDDVYKIEEILSLELKMQHHIRITPSPDQEEDEIHLGYLTMEKLAKS